MTDEVRLYARLDQHKYRVKQALRIIEDALAKNGSWHIAFSGGKDSTCTLDLVRSISPDTPAVTSIQEWCLPETTEYLRKVPNLEMVASGTDHGTGWSPNWESEEDVPEGVRWLGEKGKVAQNYGRTETGVFLGTRADENARRMVLLKTRGPLFYNRSSQAWQCTPITHWTVMDVWAYISTHGLEYNRAYDRMRDIGLPLERQRIGPLAVDRVLGYGQVAILKRGWPDLYNRFAAAHPEASGYV
jgi:phosphoadenosine phosphosulfate reductase